MCVMVVSTVACLFTPPSCRDPLRRIYGHPTFCLFVSITVWREERLYMVIGQAPGGGRKTSGDIGWLIRTR